MGASASQFRTLKYRPGFPERFGSIQDARCFSPDFFASYNERHRHSGLGLLSRAVVHYDLAGDAIEQRGAVPDAAFAAQSGTLRPQAAAAPSGAKGGLDQQTATVRE
jgi:putative transposase